MARRRPRFPAIPWETLRDAYAARFGPLLRREPEFDLGAPEPEPGEGVEKALFDELTYASLTEADPRIVLASAGAAPRVGHELFLASAIPFGGFAGVLGWLVRERAPLSPGVVVPMRLWLCPFNAVLIAPASAASVPFGEIDGAPRFALQVVPLTPAEAALGARSIEQLVDALRSGGALETVDPMRDCVLEPGTTRRFWRFARPLLLDDTLHRLEQRSKQLEKLLGFRALEVPTFLLQKQEQLVVEARLLLRYIERRHVGSGAPVARRAAFDERVGALGAIERHVGELFEAGLAPDALREPCLRMVSIVLATHPGAEELLLAAEGRPSKIGFDVEELLSRLVQLIGETRPDADLAAVLSGGRRGYEAAENRAATADGFVTREVAWERVMTGMFSSLSDRSTDESAAMSAAILRGIGAVGEALLRGADRPPIERLEDAATLVALRMTEAWYAQLGIDVPWEGEPPPGAIPPGAAKPDKKGGGRTYH